MTFSSLGLAEPLLRAVSEKGYDTPSPVQIEAIPLIISGRDVMAAAQTGTGKTAGFTLPLLHRLAAGERARTNSVRALVLTPTRELAAQVAESVTTYGKYLPLRSAVVFGGVKINPQMMRLRGGVDVLVATPGRLLDLHSQNAVKFDHLEILVLDEADRMLDMGFIHDIRRILNMLPKNRQTLMFSATFSDEIRKLCSGMLNNPAQIEVSPRNAAAKTVKQVVYEADKSRKTELLSKLIRDNSWSQVLVFTRTKHGANRLAEKLEEDGIRSAAIHGNKSQGARTKALAQFKSNDVRVLVATDIAARGIDIDQLPHVVNFELPNVPEDYVHRIGRTGRAGAEGEAISIVSADEVRFLEDIETLIQQRITRELEEGFVPVHGVPMTEPRKAGGQSRFRKPEQPRGRQGGDRAAAPGGRQGRPGQRSAQGADGNRSPSPRHASQPRTDRNGGGGNGNTRTAGAPARSGAGRNDGGGQGRARPASARPSNAGRKP